MDCGDQNRYGKIGINSQNKKIKLKKKTIFVCHGSKDP